MTNDRPNSELGRSGWEIATGTDEEGGKTFFKGGWEPKKTRS